MKMAELNAQRSKDPDTQVGACLVDNQNRILGNGYNGMPRGCPDDLFPWNKPDKHLYVCHAEMNALINVNNWSLLTGSRLYSTLFPCNECAKLIIQSGVTEVIYKDKKPHHDYVPSQKMFQSAGVVYRQFQTQTQIESQYQQISGEETVDLMARINQPNSDQLTSPTSPTSHTSPSLFETLLDILPERVLWSGILTLITLETCKYTKIPNPFLTFFTIAS